MQCRGIKMSFSHSTIPWSVGPPCDDATRPWRALPLTESVYEHGGPGKLLPARHGHGHCRLLRREIARLGPGLGRLPLGERRSLGGGHGVRQSRRGGRRRRRRERRDTGAGCIGETELSTVFSSTHSLPGQLGTVPFENRLAIHYHWYGVTFVIRSLINTGQVCHTRPTRYGQQLFTDFTRRG